MGGKGMVRDAMDNNYVFEKSEIGDLTKRLGKFRISAEVVSRDPYSALRVMARCIVTRVEYLCHIRAFDYVARSPDFDEIEDGKPIPEYLWEFNSEKKTVRAVRVDSLPPVPAMPGLEEMLDKAGKEA